MRSFPLLNGSALSTSFPPVWPVQGAFPREPDQFPVLPRILHEALLAQLLLEILHRARDFDIGLGHVLHAIARV